MTIKKLKIRSQQDIIDFLIYLHQELNIPFHPQTPFTEYVDTATSMPVFSTIEANTLKENLEECLEWCNTNNQSLFQIGGLRYNFIINNRPPFDLDGIDLNGPQGNAYVLMGLWAEAAQAAGWSEEEQAFVLKEATSKDYNHLLQTLRFNSKAD